MIDEVLTQLGHFASVVLATTIALLLIAGVLAKIRRSWGGPVEPVGFIEERLNRANTPPAAPVPVNVEYRDRRGTLIDLGPLVKGRLRNGRGAAFELVEGYFPNCDPDRIKAGTPCVVSLAEGLVKEDVRVQVDLQRQTLFIRSRFTLDEIVERIGRGGS